jgi:NodT family efflux transporter outer membrane factor (OMF) lipoprotein
MRYPSYLRSLNTTTHGMPFPVSPARKLPWLLAGTISLLSGCTLLGPDYVAPDLKKNDVPEQWTSKTDSGTRSTESATPWWSELSDPVLEQLINEAFRTSPTLDAAIARVSQARSLYAQAYASSLPSVEGSAGNDSARGNGGRSLDNRSWASLGASWEIDLFGAVQRGKEASMARAESQQATLADVRVSLAADVTDAYLGYRACQSYRALGEQDVVSRQATEKLTTASVEEGFTAPYQAIRSRASVAEAKTQLAAARAWCERQENLLTRLTGIARPGLMAVLADQPTGLDRLPVPRRFDIAIPAQALLQRPDIRAAERQLAAASAEIGVAEADRFPRLTLNGSLGYSAGNGVSLGNWSFGPSLSLPIFDGKRRQAAVAIAESKYKEALADFKAKTRSAIQEVEDGLTRYAAAHERAESARVSASQCQQFFDSVDTRYREGASNLLELEDARRAMLSARQTLLSVQQERLQAWVALNRATGGGASYTVDTPATDKAHE